MNFYKYPMIYGGNEENFTPSQATIPYILKLNPSSIKEKFSKIRQKDIFPNEIWIKVQIIPKQLQKLPVQAQLSQNNISYSPCGIYDEKSLTRVTSSSYAHSLVERLNLIYMGIGQALFTEKTKNIFDNLQEFRLDLKEHNILYTKKFLSHSEDIFIFRHKSLSGLSFTRFYLSKNGHLGLVPIYTYGGFYIPGSTSIKDIHQTYFMIVNSNNKTKIGLLTQDKINELHLRLPQITRVNQLRYQCLSPNHTEDLKSLHQEISDGSVYFSLHQKKLGLHQEYRSYGYRLDNPVTGTVEIGFHPIFD